MFEEEASSGPEARPIDRMSVDELTFRIKELRAEIAACEEELARKEAHKSAADDIFGRSG